MTRGRASGSQGSLKVEFAVVRSKAEGSTTSSRGQVPARALHIHWPSLGPVAQVCANHSGLTPDSPRGQDYSPDPDSPRV